MSTRKPERFIKRETPSPWPSSNRGWRLGVALGAALLLVLSTAILALTLIEVCDVYS